MKLRVKYEYTVEFGRDLHIWSALGAAGGIHLSIREYGDKDSPEYSGGFEVHSRTPSPNAPHDAPSHDNCWLLKGPCWHDGSSLYASEYWIPVWERDPHDHAGMFERLKGEYAKRFCQEAGE